MLEVLFDFFLTGLPSGADRGRAVLWRVLATVALFAGLLLVALYVAEPL